jgi:hypothetical protein
VKAGQSQAQLLSKDAPHVAEPGWIERGKCVQEAGLVPPAVSHPIVNGVVYRHRGSMRGSGVIVFRLVGKENEVAGNGPVRDQSHRDPGIQVADP